jgi:hypothetical protein
MYDSLSIDRISRGTNVVQNFGGGRIQVFSLFTYVNEQDSAVKEAYEKSFPLIEICAVSYKHPLIKSNTFLYVIWSRI